MANVMMHAPGNGNGKLTVNGRAYNGVAGTPIPVPDFDAAVLEANGWVRCDETGTTAQRPTTGLFVGRKFNDTTVGAQVFWDGKAWRHATTGTGV